MFCDRVETMRMIESRPSEKNKPDCLWLNRSWHYLLKELTNNSNCGTITTRNVSKSNSYVCCLGEWREDASTKPHTVPLSPTEQPRPIETTIVCSSNKPISKTVLLGLNTLLVNRDDSLFDNSVVHLGRWILLSGIETLLVTPWISCFILANVMHIIDSCKCDCMEKV
jgi:hypothetical protein